MTNVERTSQFLWDGFATRAFRVVMSCIGAVALIVAITAIVRGNTETNARQQAIVDQQTYSKEVNCDLYVNISQLRPDIIQPATPAGEQLKSTIAAIVAGAETASERLGCPRLPQLDPVQESK